MEIWSLLLLALGLSADAFAVSISKGVLCKENNVKAGILCGIWFGFFQGLMPLIGWAIGFLAIKVPAIRSFVNSFSAYIAFGLLLFLGLKMIKEAIDEINEESSLVCNENTNTKTDNSLCMKVMFIFAIATSIDALAAGLTFTATGFTANSPIINYNIWFAVSIIGLITLIFSFFGSLLGAKIGEKFKSKAEIFGGIILILIGSKILIEHLITLF